LEHFQWPSHIDHARQEDTFDAPIDEVENLPMREFDRETGLEDNILHAPLIVFLLVGSDRTGA